MRREDGPARWRPAQQDVQLVGYLLLGELVGRVVACGLEPPMPMNSVPRHLRVSSRFTAYSLMAP